MFTVRESYTARGPTFQGNRQMIAYLWPMGRWLVGMLCFGFAPLFSCGNGDGGSSAKDAALSGQDAGSSGDAGIALGPLCDPKAPRCADDEKCVTTHVDLGAPWPAPRCTPEVGADGFSEGDACFSDVGRYDYCGRGLACTNYGTGEGFCRALCTTQGAACGDDDKSVCGVVDIDSGFMLCLPRCETDQDCGVVGFLACVEREGVKFCDSARAL